MVKYCLDTGIVIAFFRNDSIIVDKIQSILEDNELFITSITLCELYKGAYRSSNSDYEISWIDNFVSSLGILDFNTESCKFFGEKFVKLQNEGKSVDDFDLMISSISKVNNATVVTRNKKDFENIGVKLEVW